MTKSALWWSWSCALHGWSVHWDPTLGQCTNLFMVGDLAQLIRGPMLVCSRWMVWEALGSNPSIARTWCHLIRQGLLPSRELPWVQGVQRHHGAMGHSNHVTSSKRVGTLLCHTTMRRNSINFPYNPAHVTLCLEVVPVVYARLGAMDVSVVVMTLHRLPPGHYDWLERPYKHFLPNHDLTVTPSFFNT